MRQRVFIFFILVLGLVLAGFVLNNHLQTAREKEIITGFAVLIAGEDPTVAQVVAYVDEYIEAVTKENAATMVLGLEQVQQANLAQWQQRYEDEDLQMDLMEIYGDRWSPQEILKRAQARGVDGKLRELLQETIENGYKVETAEGQYFPVIDYTFYRRYHEAVPPEVAAYLELMAVESEDPPVKDAALMIGWDEILRRAANQERFLRIQGAQVRGRGAGDVEGCRAYRTAIVQAVRGLLKRYLGFALYGCNNTPLFDYWTKEMDPEARRAYAEYLSHAEDGEFSTQIKAYLDVLAENDYRLTPAVDAYRKQVFSTW